MTTPISARFGYIPPSQRTRKQNELADAHVSSMRPFFIAQQTLATDRKRVVLWDASRKVYGKHLPTLYQQEGSCVEQGKMNAVNYLQCVEICSAAGGNTPSSVIRSTPACGAVSGLREKLMFANLCHGYGWTRHYSGMDSRGHGAFGSGAAKAAVEAGVCPVGGYDIPDPTITQRDGGEDMTWGSANETKYSTYKAVPDAANKEGKTHPVKSTALVTSYEQVRDAIANGYPVTVASMQGFQMKPVVDRGKHWGKASGQWAHQMCFIGVDDDGSRPGCYCLNSWGVSAHGKPADDAPPGGFWVDAEIVTRMAKQNDAFAYSQFEGFPEQKLDFMLI